MRKGDKMPTALPMTSGQKEAVRQGTKEARAIIDNNITSFKQNITRLTNLIDLVMEKYQFLETGFLDLENAFETYRGNSTKQYQKLASEYERLKQENEGMRQELARKK